MLRDRSLIPLSHQHHTALALCVLTERSLAADSSAENVARLAARVVDRYDIEMVNHFELEETVLFPLVPELREEADRLIDEHRRLTALVEQLRREPSPEALTEFTGGLRQHVRTEENEFFQQAQTLLSRETLDALGHEIDRRAVRVCL